MEKEVPNWNDISSQSVTIYTNHSILNIADIQHPGPLAWTRCAPTDGTDVKKMQVKIAKKPFAEGESRLAYYCETQFLKG